MGSRLRGNDSVGFVVLLLVAVIYATPKTFAADPARDYPNRPIRYILPNGPGSNADLFARLIAQKLSDHFGQQVVVDSRPGAGGMLGIDIAAKAAPDGYTVARGNLPALAIAPHVYKKMPYDALRDLVPVSLTDVGHNLLAIHTSVAANTVRELVALMKARPDELKMASPGVGSGGHLAAVLFTSLAGVKSLHVPYKSAGLSILAVVGNETQWTFAPIGAPLPHVRTGRLKALAVGSEKRAPQLPDVPTAHEAGVTGYYSTSWGGVVVPRGTPQSIVGKLNVALNKVLSTAEAKEQFLQAGGEASPTTAEAFSRFIKADYDRIGKTAKAAGLTAE
jgi:tripartite-type tricarboxylate transporter receptor subunit TctC